MWATLWRSENRVNTVVQILGAVGESGRGDRTDRQLLELFVKLRDEDAFAAVVRRHGPMVLGVCRRVLRNGADADDAFQAAFLVLARKAASIAGRDQLGPWLHGVAFNASRKLKRANARRSAHELARAAAAETVVLAPESHADLLAVLDEELARLPDRYRAVIVLCDLEGRTRKEVSQVLGCPEGTVGGRLARARELLAVRLRARGMSSALGVSLTVAVAPAVVAALVRAVSTDGLAHAAARGFVSRRVMDTTEGVVRSMFATKLQKVGAAVLCCGLALACATGGVHFANAQPEPEWKPVPMLTEDSAARRAREDALRAHAASQKSVKIIRLRVLDCQATAEKLTKFFSSPLVTVAPLSSEKAVLVYAPEKEMKELESLLVKLGEPVSRKVSVFKLDKNADPAEAANTLAEVFGKARAVFVPVTGDRVLLSYASEFDTVIIRKLLTKVLAAEERAIDPALKTVALKFRTPEEVAAALRKLFGEGVPVLPLTQQKQLVVLAPTDQLDTILKAVADLDRPFMLTPPLPDKENDPILKTVMLKHRKAEEVAEVIQKLIGERVQVVALKQTNQVMLLGPPSAIEIAVKLVAEQDRPLRPSTPQFVPDPTKKYTLNFQSTEWADVFDWYAETSGLALVTTAKPTGRVTIAPGNKQFTLGEVTDLINEALMQQKFILIRRKTTFSLHPADEKIDPSTARQVELKDLGACGRTEIVEVSIPLQGLDAAEIKDELRKLLTPFGELVLARGRLLLVRDTAGNVERIAKTLESIDKPRPKGNSTLGEFGGFDPRGPAQPRLRSVDSHMVLPGAKPVTFKFANATWPEVFEAYEKVTGLKGTIKSVPTGTFTPPKVKQQYTITEITDIINDALLAEKHLMIRHFSGFVVVAADDKVDPTLVPQIVPEDLEQRGRTELVQVVISVPRVPAAERAPEVKKMLGPFGSVVATRERNGLLVQDIAANVIKVCKALEK